MLPDLARSHPSHLRLLYDIPDLLEQIDEPVKGHHAYDNDYSQDIDNLDHLSRFIFDGSLSHPMNWTGGHVCGNTGVAFPASLLQFIGMYHGLWIGAGKNQMHTMTRSAVGYKEVA